MADVQFERESDGTVFVSVWLDHDLTLVLTSDTAEGYREWTVEELIDGSQTIADRPRSPTLGLYRNGRIPDGELRRHLDREFTIWVREEAEEQERRAAREAAA